MKNWKSIKGTFHILLLARKRLCSALVTPLAYPSLEFETLIHTNICHEWNGGSFLEPELELYFSQIDGNISGSELVLWNRQSRLIFLGSIKCLWTFSESSVLFPMASSYVRRTQSGPDKLARDWICTCFCTMDSNSIMNASYTFKLKSFHVYYILYGSSGVRWSSHGIGTPHMGPARS